MSTTLLGFITHISINGVQSKYCLIYMAQKLSLRSELGSVSCMADLCLRSSAYSSVLFQLHAFMDELHWWQVWFSFCHSQLNCPASGLNLLHLHQVFADPEALTCWCCLHPLFANCLMPPFYLIWHSSWDLSISTTCKYLREISFTLC